MLATLTDDELIWEIELAVEQANADGRGLALAPELREQLREASSHE